MSERFKNNLSICIKLESGIKFEQVFKLRCIIFTNTVKSQELHKSIIILYSKKKNKREIYISYENKSMLISKLKFISKFANLSLELWCTHVRPSFQKSEGRNIRSCWHVLQ